MQEKKNKREKKFIKYKVSGIANNTDITTRIEKQKEYSLPDIIYIDPHCPTVKL